MIVTPEAKPATTAFSWQPVNVCCGIGCTTVVTRALGEIAVMQRYPDGVVLVDLMNDVMIRGLPLHLVCPADSDTLAFEEKRQILWAVANQMAALNLGSTEALDLMNPDTLTYQLASQLQFKSVLVVLRGASSAFEHQHVIGALTSILSSRSCLLQVQDGPTGPDRPKKRNYLCTLVRVPAALDTSVMLPLAARWSRVDNDRLAMNPAFAALAALCGSLLPNPVYL